MVASQDIAHGNRVNRMPQICQCPLDASVAPGGILFGHTDHKLFDLLRHPWPTNAFAVPAAVKLLCNEAVVPAHEGLGRDERGDLFQALAPERVGQRREAAPFSIGEMEPAATKLGCEDTVFLH
jgi:hypothetical protein